MAKFTSHRVQGIAGRSDNECRMLNVEVMYSVKLNQRLSKAIPHWTFDVRCSMFDVRCSILLLLRPDEVS